VLPHKMAELYSKACGTKIVELDEDWAERTHAIVIRSYDALQVAGKRLIDHLRRSAG
jgi:hypothetical protein